MPWGGWFIVIVLGVVHCRWTWMLVLTCFAFHETNFIYFLNGSNHLANSEGKAAWITHTFEVPIIRALFKDCGLYYIFVIYLLSIS